MALVSRAAALSALAVLALAAPAFAGPPGTWTKVTNFNSQSVNFYEVSVARGGDGTLNVLWTQDSTEAVLNTRLSADAQNVLGTSTVFDYTGGVNDVELLPLPGGGLRAFFAGLISSDQKHDGGLSTATSADGVTWAVQPTLASETDGSDNEQSTVYAAAGIGGTLFSNGTPLSIWGSGNAGYHVGTSETTPDVRFGGSTDVFDPDAATDSATGQVAIAWNSIDTESVQTAFVQQTTSPWFPPGPATAPPGSGAPETQDTIGITGRSGGADGIYVAYLRGDNPFNGKAAVWRIGAANAATLSRRDAHSVSIAMGPGGRLWTFWVEDEDDLEIHARRSNADADAWSDDVVVKPPAGASTVWSLKGEGTGLACGALDVVAHATVGSDLADYHQRVLPGLTLKKKLLNGGRGEKAKVRFTTLDAGEPVNATVDVGKQEKATGGDGKVKFKIDRKRRTKKVKAIASNACYEDDLLRVKIKKDRD